MARLLAVVAADLENDLLAFADIALIKPEIVDPAAARRSLDPKIERGGIFADPETRLHLPPRTRAVGHFVLQRDPFVTAVADQHPEPFGLKVAVGSQHADLQPEIGVSFCGHAIDRKRRHDGHTPRFGSRRNVQQDIVAARSPVVARRRAVGRHEGVHPGEPDGRGSDAVGLPGRIAAHGDRLRNSRVPGPGADVADQLVIRPLRYLDLCGNAVQRVEMQRRRAPRPRIEGCGDLHRLVAVSRTGRDGQPVGLLVEVDHPVDVRHDLERNVAALVGHSALVGADRGGIEREGPLPGFVRTAGPRD